MMPARSLVRMIAGNTLRSRRHFVLSAFGMFLFVRELTGSRSAAFLAGVAYGFAPYRFGTLSHLQVLSSMWMPFAWLPQT